MSKAIDRTGERFQDKLGNWGTIVKYNTGHDLYVKYDNHEELIHADYSNIKKKHILSPYAKTVCGVGCKGVGKYKMKINGEHTMQYKYWHSMMVRSYTEEFATREETYKDVTVCEEWHNFQNFAKWFDENFYTINDERMQLDKDILHKGNKMYSPDTCIFVPQKINCLFIKSNKLRGKYPIGVTKNSSSKNFSASVSKIHNNKKKIYHIGSFNTPEEAFYAYKEAKEKYIKQIADEYKDKIPQKLYEAMYRYEVEITD